MPEGPQQQEEAAALAVGKRQGKRTSMLGRRLRRAREAPAAAPAAAPGDALAEEKGAEQPEGDGLLDGLLAKAQQQQQQQGEEDEDEDEEDEEDEDEEDPRQIVDIDVETVREAVAMARNVNHEHHRASRVRVYCVKRRLKARRDLKQVTEEHDESLKEYRRIICDPYDSQLASVVERAERDLERRELVLADQKAHREYFEFGDANAHLLAKALKHCRDLEEVQLARNDIGSVGVKSLCAVLNKQERLARLDLSNNPLGPDGAQHLCKVLAKCRKLRVLNLHGCHLGAEGAEILAGALGKHRALVDISLRGNKLGPEGLLAIAEQLIRVNDVLLDLDLATNDFGWSRAVEALADALDANKRLRRLDLSHNGLLQALRRPQHRKLHLRLRKVRLVGIWPREAMELDVF